jgi:hypothetical protein
LSCSSLLVVFNFETARLAHATGTNTLTEGTLWLIFAAAYLRDTINGKVRFWKLFRQVCCRAIDRVAAAKERMAIVGRLPFYMRKDGVNDAGERQFEED